MNASEIPIHSAITFYGPESGASQKGVVVGAYQVNDRFRLLVEVTEGPDAGQTLRVPLANVTDITLAQPVTQITVTCSVEPAE